MTLPRSAELQWQEETIEMLHTPGIPADARATLIEMLRNLKQEKEDLRVADS